ncbi:hypothetical protein THF1C08_30027 [Vibrio jasicida]|uniref:Uncharacterized protein n=1 Tax=Vibrio jasicida TaxID=766224 RepID=A0AAU9QVA0_9VIBR|nr:hypothetical protein THF1C08_30027 [Vibrio jasicida]CAH1600077.1 hypothetical protein THF1A12_40407 [Vibrio jasicida]
MYTRNIKQPMHHAFLESVGLINQNWSLTLIKQKNN